MVEAAIVRFPDGPAPVPTADHLARTWAEAMAGTGVVPMSRRALVAFLTGLAADLVATVTAETFDRAVPLRVGGALVDAHFTEIGSIERTLALLGRELAARTPADADRVVSLQGAVAAGYAAALQDRTRPEQERRSAAAEQARWTSEARFRTVFDEAVIGIGLADIDGTVLEVNRALARCSAARTASCAARGSRSTSIPTTSRPWDQIKDLVAGRSGPADGEVVLPGGRLRDLDRSRRLPGPRPGWAAALRRRDDGEHHRAPPAADAPAAPGTPRPPHRPAQPDHVLRAARRRAGRRIRPGVCYLDLDGFKAVNDTLGHDKGDALLHAVARRLTEALGLHLVARMGGDEFVVLVEHGADDDALREVARSALQAVRHPVPLDENEIVVSASIGVVRADGDQDAAELMKAADTTLYWAKADGRNRFALFDEARHRSDVDRFEMSARMPDALARGEFSLEFQPLVRLADRSAIGVEALVRWTLPGGERLDPGRFVPLAEDSGFIVPLGRWVLEQACRSAAAWAVGDPAARVLMSVNVAARQLREPFFVDEVAAVLAETGWPAELLQLELTESALMGTPDGSLAALHALADLGVCIAIDDFGTGYSNFAYLRRLPVHVLKLAGSFITGVTGRAV